MINVAQFPSVLTFSTVTAWWSFVWMLPAITVYIYVCYCINQAYSGITCGRVLNGELYT